MEERDITGQRFGRLIAIRRAENNAHGGARWLFKCDCGNEAVLLKSQVMAGRTVSCGCKRREGIVVGNRSKRGDYEENKRKAAERAEMIRKQRAGEL